jgi:hypothetical protein
VCRLAHVRMLCDQITVSVRSNFICYNVFVRYVIATCAGDTGD